MVAARTAPPGRLSARARRATTRTLSESPASRRACPPVVHGRRPEARRARRAAGSTRTGTATPLVCRTATVPSSKHRDLAEHVGVAALVVDGVAEQQVRGDRRAASSARRPTSRGGRAAAPVGGASPRSGRRPAPATLAMRASTLGCSDAGKASRTKYTSSAASKRPAGQLHVAQVRPDEVAPCRGAWPRGRGRARAGAQAALTSTPVT